jgi:hypothetical protein
VDIHSKKPHSTLSGAFAFKPARRSTPPPFHDSDRHWRINGKPRLIKLHDLKKSRHNFDFGLVFVNTFPLWKHPSRRRNTTATTLENLQWGRSGTKLTAIASFYNNERQTYDVGEIRAEVDLFHKDAKSFYPLLLSRLPSMMDFP